MFKAPLEAAWSTGKKDAHYAHFMITHIPCIYAHFLDCGQHSMSRRAAGRLTGEGTSEVLKKQGSTLLDSSTLLDF